MSRFWEQLINDPLIYWDIDIWAYWPNDTGSFLEAFPPEGRGFPVNVAMLQKTASVSPNTITLVANRLIDIGWGPQNS